MTLPRMSAGCAVAARPGHYGAEGAPTPARRDAVVPEVCVGSPCLRVPSGRMCVHLPIVGRRCVTIPSFGSWRVRCCTRFGWPPVSCGVSRC